ncbi:hypothetical protein GUJ93_ZPchr0012g22227 [Zizania palustris]|uniref:Uncharacterized protein n=1 Tax=Zizania palustris TaxID=103762 RepID=A0A8J5WLC5_ZIZPA|nr:hypothetical protein GUJ93_ZPchr0012g22227 [Zizania palustris]
MNSIKCNARTESRRPPLVLVAIPPGAVACPEEHTLRLIGSLGKHLLRSFRLLVQQGKLHGAELKSG